jgi:alcohol dehydrogenase
MRAAYYETFEGPGTVEDLPDPIPPEDGVVIKVEATGLCLSDWHGWKGHDPDITCPMCPATNWPVWFKPPGRGSDTGSPASG